VQGSSPPARSAQAAVAVVARRMRFLPKRVYGRRHRPGLRRRDQAQQLEPAALGGSPRRACRESFRREATSSAAACSARASACSGGTSGTFSNLEKRSRDAYSG